MTDKRWFIGLTIALICISLNVYSADSIYTTDFSLTEDRISEGGNMWVNGKATGIDWANVKTSNGNASGTQVRDPARPYWYNDSVAILKGTWGADQSIEGVIYLANQTDGGVSGFGSYNGVDCGQEVELCVRGSISPGAVRMYCMDVSARQDSTAYHESGAWIGGIYDFFQDKGFTSTESGDFIVHDGDTIKLSISGNTLNGYLNGNIISSVDIRYYSGGAAADVITSGNPGIGFYSGRGCVGTNHESDFGFKSITATGKSTSTAKAPNTPSIISIK